MGKVKSNVTERFRRKVGDVKLSVTPAVLQEILFIGRSNAAAITPVDTSNMLNSMYTEIQPTASGFSGRVGFTAWYSRVVHELPGTLKGQPRAHFGKTAAGVEFGGGTGRGNYWDPNGEPQFLKKGFERDGKEAIEDAIKRGYS